MLSVHLHCFAAASWDSPGIIALAGSDHDGHSIMQILSFLMAGCSMVNGGAVAGSRF